MSPNGEMLPWYVGDWGRFVGEWMGDMLEVVAVGNGVVDAMIWSSSSAVVF